MSAGPVNAVTYQLPVSVELTLSSGHTAGADQTLWTLINSNNPIYFPIVLPVGARITAYTLHLNKLSSGAHTHAGRINRRDINGSKTSLGVGSTNSTNAPGVTSMTENSLTIDVADGNQYWFEFTPDATSANDVVYHLDVFYSFPVPV